MDTGRQQRPRLRIASRGKNYRALDSAIGVGVVMDPAKSLTYSTVAAVGQDISRTRGKQKSA